MRLVVLRFEVDVIQTFKTFNEENMVKYLFITRRPTYACDYSNIFTSSKNKQSKDSTQGKQDNFLAVISDSCHHDCLRSICLFGLSA